MNEIMVHRLKKNILAVLLFAAMVNGLHGQTTIEGYVKDHSTKEPLAFVNIIFYPSGYGAVSDMKGFFRLKLPENTDSIEISYLGYEKKYLVPDNINIKTAGIIYLQEKPLEIEELMFSPKENPADLVINKAVEYRKFNDPLELDAFSYISYDKMYFTFDTSSYVSLSDVSVFNQPDKHYLFLLENLTQTKYKKPDLTEDQIIASKASGFENPSMVLLISHLQSFSFYDEQVRLGSIRYYNPVSKEKNRYLFHMMDTLISDTDTIYVIAFNPASNSCNQCLKGFVHINSDKWAIQHVVAEAAVTGNGNMDFKIQQKYERVNFDQWFPAEYNVLIKFSQNSKSAEKGKMIAVGSTFITNVRINPEFQRSDFDKYNIRVKATAGETNDSLLAAYRNDSLNQLEQETYRIIDSLGKRYYFEPIFNGIEYMFNGFLPIGTIDIDLSKIIDYNEFEGLRMGFGLRTNRKLSKYFRIGGYTAYGFKDKQYKYGAEGSVFFNPYQSSGISFSYKNDMEESGNIYFLENIVLSSSEYFRHFFVSTKVKNITRKLAVFGEPVRYMRAEAFIKTNDVEELQDYTYSIGETIPAIGIKNFLFTDFGVRLRYAFGEEKILTPEFNTFVSESRYPIVWLNYEQSTKAFHGQYQISRITAKIKTGFRTGFIGKTYVTLMGGVATGKPPLYKLFNGRGSYQTFGIDADNTFATMRINEFYSDKFVAVFHKQYLGGIRIFEKLKPEFTWNNNFGIGELAHRDLHEGLPFNTLDKGYFESGIVIDNLIRIPLFRYGFGVYYRYGPYAFEKISDNFAYNLSVKLAI